MNAVSLGLGLATFVLTSACAPRVSVSQLGYTVSHCAPVTLPPDASVGPSSADKFVGRYLRGSETLFVRRVGARLFVTGPTLGERELSTGDLQSWAWRDGCGVSYQFTLPSDGPGARLRVELPDRTSTEWSR